MATSEGNKKRKHAASSPPEQRRKVTKVSSGPLTCPICDLTLWPGRVEQHYRLELSKLASPTPSPSLAHSRKRHSSSSATAKEVNSREKKLFKHVQKVLESVKRRRILFAQPPTQSSSSHLSLDPGSSSSALSPPCCPVCSCPLPAEGALAEAHVNDCLGREEEAAGSSSDESFDEYTWCDVTRVRATSMLTPEARANMFGGTVISNMDTSVDDEVDVEDDETALYGPPQYDEGDVQRSMESFGREEEEEEESMKQRDDVVNINSSSQQKHQQHCLICMDHYQNPVVSIKCWHVYCEKCWLQALGSKKLCPKCKDITSTGHLRKIFL